MIDIVDASFETSAPNVKLSTPNEYQNEVAFMARSNVGKSSLLNALTKRKSLAKVSSTPGKTRLINYFKVTFLDRENGVKNEAKFVDLPGFGYAKVSKSIKADWEKNLTDFIASRRQIKLFIHLIDCRHPDLDIDHSVLEFLQENITPDQVILQIFTKIDKLNQREIGALRREFPHAIMVSNTKKRGLDKLTTFIYETLFVSEHE